MGSSGTATNAVGSGTTMAAGNTAPSNSGTGGQAEKTSTGVQRLLDTEREANRLVLEARQYRVERIKAAREEAALEVAKLKQAKQADYLMHEKSILADLNTMVEDCNQQTKLELEKMQSEAVDRIPSAAELLLNRVLSVSSPTSSETQ